VRVLGLGGRFGVRERGNLIFFPPLKGTLRGFLQCCHFKLDTLHFRYFVLRGSPHPSSTLDLAGEMTLLPLIASVTPAAHSPPFPFPLPPPSRHPPGTLGAAATSTVATVAVDDES
jgi:hypothetical protein